MYVCVCKMLINDRVVYLYFIMVILCEKKKEDPPIGPSVHSCYLFCLNGSGAPGAQH